MKKTSILIAASLCSSLCFAQLKVYQNGNVGIGSNLNTTNSQLNIGDRTYGSNDYSVFLTSSNPIKGTYSIGVDGWAYNDTIKNTRRTMGIRGIAGNGNNGNNYGVMGVLKGTQNGSGVYGAVNTETGIATGGIYAGFFDGDMKTTGVSKIRMVNTHDPNMSTLTLQNALAIVSLLRPATKTYYYPSLTPGDDSGDGTETEIENDGSTGDRLISDTHFGIVPTISQQFPANLIVSDASQHIYVNYTELIPVLVGAIQELYTRLNYLDECASNSNSFYMDEAADIKRLQMSPEGTGQCMLFQNNPNPFGENTVIKYSVPEDTGDAWIYVFDMQGKLLKQLRLDTKTDRVILHADDLTPGMYLYSLIVNGKEIDTKRMINTK